MTALEERAAEWIAPFWNARHLVRTLDRLLELEPAAGEALRLAALTHDIERHFPGGEQFDPAVHQARDEEYRRAHSERSAQIVGDWLEERGADEALAGAVRELIRLHEVGGTPEADLLQAADSVSFLETNADLVERWVRDGRCSPGRAREQLDWMFLRIRIPRASRLARPLYEQAVARVLA